MRRSDIRIEVACDIANYPDIFIQNSMLPVYTKSLVLQQFRSTWVGFLQILHVLNVHCGISGIVRLVITEEQWNHLFQGIGMKTKSLDLVALKERSAVQTLSMYCIQN